MKPRSIIIVITIVLFGVLILAGTQFPIFRISPILPAEQISLLSYHQRHVFAEDGGDDWAIRQELKLEPCGYLTLRHTWNGKITLETCHGRYITAPKSGQNRDDRILKQETKPGECGQFDMYELGNDRVAFKTCTGRFFTAGDNGLGWEGQLQWAIVGDTKNLDTWEIFIIEQK